MLNTRIWICFMLFFGVYDYCQNEFDHVNKHKWRCKARFDQSNHSNNVQNQDTLPVIDNISRSTDLISCICGKQCKGLKGLKAHHRSCKTIKSFGKEIVNDLNSQDINEAHIDIDSDVCRETPSLKTGIKLSSNDKQWEMANEYFKANMNCGEVSSADDINK